MYETDNLQFAGVAILSSPPERLSDKREALPPVVAPPSNPTPANGPKLNPRQKQINNTQAKIQKLLKDIEDQDQTVIVKLGDASIAAPFTSRLSSIQCSRLNLAPLIDVSINRCHFFSCQFVILSSREGVR